MVRWVYEAQTAKLEIRPENFEFRSVLNGEELGIHPSPCSAAEFFASQPGLGDVPSDSTGWLLTT